jgi:hypothetical protein
LHYLAVRATGPPRPHTAFFSRLDSFIHQVGDFLAREKVSQAFRDALAPQYRSSKKFKHEKRRQRDKAAKLAKQTNLPEASKDKQSKPKGKAKASGAESKPFVIKRSLSVLREEPPAPAVHPFAATATGTGTGSIQSNRRSRAMSLPHDQSVSSQGYNDAYSGGMDDQMLGFQGYASLGSQGMMHPQDAAAGSRATNWHGMYGSPPTGIFNHIHSGNNLPSNMAAVSPRRFSDSVMTDSNQAPFHFHHQHQQMSGDNWGRQQHQMPRLNPSALLGGANAALHASFPSGVNVGMMGIHPHTTIGMQRRMGSGMTRQHAGLMTNQIVGASDHEMSAMQFQNHQHHHSGRASATRGNFSARSSSLERSNSHVPNVSHSVVERLESSFSALPQDENPFEPVPLPHERGNQGNEKDKADDDEDSIVTDW